jgi:UDP-N-acetylglucosamine transferase subunit ALG13|tara:strand:+ start:1821 stop:2039 length:219 start_codon:yes stop_codon:yes gene_type:complete
MIIVSKEQMQELDQTIDERLLWEYISAQNEMKVAMLSIYDFVTIDNIDQVLEEYVSIKRLEWTNVSEESQCQ